MKKLFSSLSPKKKDEVFQNTIDLALNTLELSKELRNEIRNQINLDKLIHNRSVFNEMVKRQRVFTHKELTFTTNVIEIKNKMEV